MALFEAALGGVIGYLIGKGGRRLEDNPTVRVHFMGGRRFAEGPYTELGAQRRVSKLRKDPKVASAKVITAGGRRYAEFYVRAA